MDSSTAEPARIEPAFGQTPRAKRLGCGPDLKGFDKKLEKIAKALPKPENPR